MSLTCPVCNYSDTVLYHEDRLRNYYQCKNCELVFVPETYHLSRQEEKARYKLHENHPDDKEYRRFLKQFFKPMNKRLTDHSKGLDLEPVPALRCTLCSNKQVILWIYTIFSLRMIAQFSKRNMTSSVQQR